MLVSIRRKSYVLVAAVLLGLFASFGSVVVDDMMETSLTSAAYAGPSGGSEK